MCKRQSWLQNGHIEPIRVAKVQQFIKTAIPYPQKSYLKALKKTTFKIN